MEKRQGTLRTVYLAEDYALKVPRLHPEVFPSIIKQIRKGHFEFVKKWLRWDDGVQTSFRWATIGGLRENLRERDLSDEMGSIVVPTRLSVQGVLNMQDLAQDLPLSEVQVTDSLIKHLGDDYFKDAHTFSNPNNYGVHEGFVKFRDYGSRRAAPIFQARKASLSKALDELSEQLPLKDS